MDNLELSINNLKDFCRTCLAATASASYDLRLLPRLSKLMIHFTSLDMDEEQVLYPKRVCQCCYDKLIDYQEFRRLAQQSTETLFGIVHTRVVDIATSNAEEYDEQLMLPEFTIKFLETVKSEPIDTPQLQATDAFIIPHQEQPADILLQAANNHDEMCLVKNEIDSECDELEAEATNNDSSLGDDDADDSAAYVYAKPLNGVHTSEHGGGDDIPKNSGYTRKSLKCPHCDKRFYKQVNLVAHIRGVHEGHKKSFLCPECDSAFSHYKQMRVHIQSKHKALHLAPKSQHTYRCPFGGCEAQFKTSKILGKHLRLVHTCDSTDSAAIVQQEIVDFHRAQINSEIEVNLVCQQCFKKFNSKQDLKIHLKRHLQIKEYVCKVCGIGKVTSTELQTHMRRHEVNAAKFQCPLCPKLFKHKNAIGRHVRVIHDGVRAYECQYCPKRFGTRHTAEAHERIHEMRSAS